MGSVRCVIVSIVECVFVIVIRRGEEGKRRLKRGMMNETFKNEM